MKLLGSENYKKGRMKKMYHYYSTSSVVDDAYTVATVAMIIGILVYVVIVALFVFACRKIAMSKGLSPNYMWLGLLGLIGIIIVAMPGNQNPYQDPRYAEYMKQYNQNLNNQNQYGGQNQYGQNPYNQNQYGQNPYNQNQYGQNPYNQNQYGGQNQYGHNPYDQNNLNQGYNLNGQNDLGNFSSNICSKCGASVGTDSAYCPFCGNKVG